MLSICITVDIQETGVPMLLDFLDFLIIGYKRRYFKGLFGRLAYTLIKHEQVTPCWGRANRGKSAGDIRCLRNIFIANA